MCFSLCCCCASKVKPEQSPPPPPLVEKLKETKNPNEIFLSDFSKMNELTIAIKQYDTK